MAFDIGGMLSGAGGGIDWLKNNPDKVNTGALALGQVGQALNPTGNFANLGVSLPTSSVVASRYKDQQQKQDDWLKMLASALGHKPGDFTPPGTPGISKLSSTLGPTGIPEHTMSLTGPTSPSAPSASMTPDASTGEFVPGGGAVATDRDLSSYLPFF